MNKKSIIQLVLSAILLCSCSGQISVRGLNPTGDLPGKRFYLTTQEDLLDKYPTLESIDLYDYIPHLDQLPITVESFEEIRDILEGEAKRVGANRAILMKSGDCHAEIGYCNVELIYK